MANQHVNAVVIGAGAGGGIAAKELSVAGLSVVLLERGRWQRFEDNDRDELISQRTTVLGNAYGPDDRSPRVVESANGSTRIVRPHEGGYSNNAACVGGGTLSYGAMAWRFMPEDFKMRSTYGAVEGSSLEDWPISYEDLEPYYEKAEYEIGVAGDDSKNPFGPPRKNPFPMPAFPYSRSARLIDAAATKLGLHPFPIPMLRNSVPYGNRPACIHMRECVGFACPVDAKNGTQNTVIPTALATGNCEIRTECKVSQIEIDDQGRAKGIHYFDAYDKKQFQSADLVVVAASATETARLLLNSKSRLFPDGAGNRHDWVGRNLQGHAYSGASGLFEEDMYDSTGPGACIAFCDFNHHVPGHISGGAMCNSFLDMPYLFTKRRPPGSPRWGLKHKEYQRNFFRRYVALHGPIQELPVFDARVRIDPEVRDHWGIPVLRLSGYRHPNDPKVAKYICEVDEQILKEMGAIETWQNVAGTSGPSGGQHQAGTCRMGDDPTTSVVNKYGQVHDIDNLFLADGSVLVTNGGFNPVLTIMAVSYWVSEHIVREWKGTQFRG